MAKYLLEYVWLDGYEPVPNLRGKTLVKDFGSFPKLEELPKWGFDGSSTRQAEGHNSDCVLKPVAVYPDTTKRNGVLVMNEVLTILGPTPYPQQGYPNAVYEWCINTAAVDPFTKSILVNSEDGNLYRWDLTSNTLTEKITLSTGIGEAYTPTVIGADGTDYAINDAILDAIGTPKGH